MYVHMYLGTMHVIVPGRRYPYAYSVRMENSTETALSFLILANYVLIANVSVTTAAHMLGMGEILLVLSIFTLRMQWIVDRESDCCVDGDGSSSPLASLPH